MTKQARLAGNRLMAEFMSRSFSMSHIGDYKNAPDNELPPMKYHCNWHWLMPAWYKFVELRFDDPMIQFKHSELKTTVGYAILYGDTQLAFANLVDAIKTIQRLTNK